MWCYSRILTHYPYVVLVAVLIVSITCLIVTVTKSDGLSFEDPMVGFEPRGTDLSNRLTAYQNLIDDPDISLIPDGSQAVVQNQENKLLYVDWSKKNSNRTSPYQKYRREKRRRSDYFCDIPDRAYGKIVYRSLNDGDLFTLDNIHIMCEMEERFVRSKPIFLNNCMLSRKDHCCRSLSLGNYIALLSNKESCQEINQTDVNYVLDLVQSCMEYYNNFNLTGDCDSRHSRYENGYDCSNVPKKCQKHNAVFNIIHYVADASFQRNVKKLKYAVSFLPIQFTADNVNNFIQLYLDIEESIQPVSDVEVAAVDFHIKYNLFQYYIEKDSILLILCGVAIFIFVWIFTGSIFITFMTFLSMFWSLELAYFLYVFVFEIKFFPYMNMATVLLIIAIGADDVFVYTKIWYLAKKERNNGTLEKIVSDTLKHATLSMFVTSLTTACALFANFVSPITSIQCFGIYAGTTMMCNLFLMVTWIPASIVVQEKWCNCCFINSPKIYSKYRKFYQGIFRKKLPSCVVRVRYILIFVLGGLGVFGGVIVFHYPKLKLPTSFKFQVFRKTHLLELYDQEIRDYFWFEKSAHENIRMPLSIVWGLQDIENGNKLNPYEKSTLEFDRTFDITAPAAQTWLLDFCQNLRKSEFYQKVESIEYTNCFIEHFKDFMTQPCRNKDFPCCKESHFPFSKSVFNQCIKKYINLLIQTPSVSLRKWTPGLHFSGNQVRALSVKFSSKLVYTLEYDKVKDFYTRMDRWVTEQLLTAPVEMQNGWFISDLRFFSLQESLSEGMPLALGVSLLVSALVTFFTSLNVLITVYAIITITCIMLVTIASLVLMGWELNILETVVITIAVGLSIDQTLHYGVAYRLSPDLDRHNRSLCSMVRVGDVIFMAALTTFLAGLIMVPSVTLVYHRFGVFLMLVISISWVYSTFFLQALLNVIGPQGGCGQFHWPSLDCCSISPRSRIDLTTYTMSESTMSSSSSGYPYHPTTDTQDHDLLSERSESGSSFHHRPVRTGRYYNRPHSESLSPDVQSCRKLLTEDSVVSSEVPKIEHSPTQKLCTEV